MRRRAEHGNVELVRVAASRAIADDKVRFDFRLPAGDAISGERGAFSDSWTRGPARVRACSEPVKQVRHVSAVAVLAYSRSRSEMQRLERPRRTGAGSWQNGVLVTLPSKDRRGAQSKPGGSHLPLPSDDHLLEAAERRNRTRVFSWSSDLPNRVCSTRYYIACGGTTSSRTCSNSTSRSWVR